MKNSTIFSVLVDNHAGVLIRVLSLFSRRGFNLDSIIACSTDNPKFSRLTVITKGDDAILAQITRQLLKLEDVYKVAVNDEETSSYSELLLMKVSKNNGNISELLKCSQPFGAKVIDIGEKSITFELSGQGSVLDDFTKELNPFGLLELSRSGINALERGDKTIYEDLY